MRARSTCIFTALFASGVWCVPAAAQTPAVEVADVELSIPDCEGIAGAEIAKLVRLELSPRQSAAASETRGGVTRASMHCTHEHATISVVDPRRPEPLVLELTLDATPPEARARFLALALAELIATSRLERVDARVASSQPEPQPVTPAQPQDATSVEPEPAGAEHRLELFAQAGAARAFKPALFAPAVAAGAALVFAPFAVISDIAYERGQTRTPDADIVAHGVSLSLTPAWRVTLKPVTLSLALGLRAGYALLSASPRTSQLQGHDVTGLFLAPISDASVQLALSEHWALRLAFELGYVIKPLRGLDANQATLLELAGTRMTALLGLAFAP